MKSPFPGMDPYLEQHWRDVHASLIIYGRDQLRECLPRDLRCRVEERVFVETEEGVGRSMYIRVVEKRLPRSANGVAGGVATAEPLVLHLESEPVTETYIEVIDVASGNKVITVIEFLSLANKVPGEGQRKYLSEQKQMREGKVSLVEIDLQRNGHRVLAVSEELFPLSFRTPYRICVCRGWEPEKAEIYRVPLREPLPTIRIPLRPTDADVPFALQPLIEQCYRQGDYEDIDYTKNPDPPLEPDDAAWADALLRQAGKR